MISRLTTLTLLPLATATPAMAAFQTLAGGTAQTIGSYYIGGIYEPMTLSQKDEKEGTWSGGNAVTVSAFGTQTTHQLIRPTNAVIDQPITWYSQAQAGGNGSAEPGRLHAYASASALMNPTTQSLVYEDNVTKEIKEYTAVNPVHAYAQATVRVGWQDTLTITSDTLPAGSLVNVDLTAVLDSTISNPHNTPNTGVTTTFYASSPSTSLSFQVAGSTTSNTASKSRAWTFRVGETVTLTAYLNVSAYAWAGYNINYTGQIVPNDATFVDASNTGHYYFDIAPGVDASVVSSSGHNYSVTAPVPEPASLLSLLLIGGLALTSRRRRPTVTAA